MNYYENHIGDYLKDTAHLSLLEHGVYKRLLDVYYTRETPLPDDVARLIGARSKDEKAALASVLQEFFMKGEDGWHQGRCDAEIAKFHESAPDREAKREAERERQKRTRERRANLFNLLRENGVVPAYDTPMSELHRLASRYESQGSTRDSHAPVTRDNTATHTQSPIPDPISLIPSNLAVAPAFPEKAAGDDLAEGSSPDLPDCPHKAVLALWNEVMPDLPQHNPELWKGTRADHLRARWRETAALKGWRAHDDGLRFFRKLLEWCRQSRFLMGKVPPPKDRRPFEFELAWLVNPTNWAKTLEGKFHGQG